MPQSQRVGVANAEDEFLIRDPTMRISISSMLFCFLFPASALALDFEAPEEPDVPAHGGGMSAGGIAVVKRTEDLTPRIASHET